MDNNNNYGNNGNQQYHLPQYGYNGVNGYQNVQQYPQDTVRGQHPSQHQPNASVDQNHNAFPPQNHFIFSLNNEPLFIQNEFENGGMEFMNSNAENNQDPTDGFANYEYANPQQPKIVQHLLQQDANHMDTRPNPSSDNSLTFYQMQNVPNQPTANQEANNDRLVPTDGSQDYRNIDDFVGNYLNNFEDDDYDNFGSPFLREGVLDEVLRAPNPYPNNNAEGFVNNNIDYEEPPQQQEQYHEPYSPVRPNQPVFEQNPFPQIAPANPLEFNMEMNDENVADIVVPPPPRPARQRRYQRPVGQQRGRGRPRRFTDEERRLRHNQSCNNYNERREAARAHLRQELLQFENNNAILRQELENLLFYWNQIFGQYSGHLTVEEREKAERRIFEIRNLN